MVPAVSSTSAALKVLQVQAPQQAASGEQNQDPLHRFLDPRSVLALGSQSFDNLLKLRAELRRDPVQEASVQQAVSPTPKAGRPGHSGMLAWENEGSRVETSSLDLWMERMQRLKARTSGSLDSALMPWNSPDVIQQVKDMAMHGARASARERDFIASDAAIYKGMAETPPEDVARIKAKGGEIWYEDSQFSDRRSDKEFFRDAKNYALYGAGLDEPIDPSSELSQALLSGTAQIIRGSSIPGYYSRTFTYTMYAHNSEANQYKWIGGWTRGEGNSEEIFRNIAKNNPNMHLVELSFNNDAAFILYPKIGAAAPASTAVAQGTAAATGAKPVAASAR